MEGHEPVGTTAMLSPRSAKSKVALTTVSLCPISKEQLYNITVSGALGNSSKLTQFTVDCLQRAELQMAVRTCVTQWP